MQGGVCTPWPDPFCRPGRLPVIGFRPQPDRGNPAVRDERGGRGKRGHGGTGNPPRIPKGRERKPSAYSRRARGLPDPAVASTKRVLSRSGEERMLVDRAITMRPHSALRDAPEVGSVPEIGPNMRLVLVPGRISCKIPTSGAVGPSLRNREFMMKYVLIVAGIVVAFVIVQFIRALGNVHACARTGRVDRLRALLAKNPDLIKAVNSEGETPVHQAAKYNQMEALRFLVEQGGDVNARANQRTTPLHLAAAFGEIEAVKYLLEKGAEVDPREETGMTPVMGAQARNHRAIIEVLKQAGADVDAVPSVVDFGGGHFMTPIADNDPLMLKASAKARQALPTLRQLFRELPRNTMVKFAFTTDGGQTEHLWGDLLELTDDTFKVRVKTPPATHKGNFEKVQQHAVAEIEDWQVEQHDGHIRGGYGFQVVFHRTKERLGQLPKALAQHEGRFVDHDIAALLKEVGESGAAKTASA